MSEQALAAHVVAWLEAQHWDVYQEVGHGDVADIVAVRGAQIWIIECKTSLSLTVMHQASRWHVPMRSIAVPFARRYDDRALAERICREFLRVGVLYVDEDGPRVTERVAPPLLREFYESGWRFRGRLRPEHKTAAPAGTNGGGRWTPYRQTMGQIEIFLKLKGEAGATLKEIMGEVGKGHYASTASARSGIPTCLEKVRVGLVRDPRDRKGASLLLSTRAGEQMIKCSFVDMIAPLRLGGPRGRQEDPPRREPDSA